MPTPFARRLRRLPAALAFATASLLARADCIDDAATRHGVNASVLRAIGWQESRLQPAAIGHNTDGSIDVGAFQINSVHLPELARLGIDRTALGDGCMSAEVAAWHYRRQIDELGDTWAAVGAYHSHTSARAAWYANRIAEILMHWNAMPPGAPPFPAARAPAITPASARASTTGTPPLPVANATPAIQDAHVAPLRELDYLPSAR